MSGRTAAAHLALIAAGFGGLACAGARRAPVQMTFEVEQRPPEPPAPSPPPPAEAPSMPAVETAPPAGTAGHPDGRRAEERVRLLNEALEPVYFETGRWSLAPESEPEIEAAARLLREAGAFSATVEGHADERGSDSYNYVLGIWRAKSVKDRLRDLGVDPSRMTIVSHGKKRPAVGGTDQKSLSRNRRVQIVVRSLHPE